MRYDRPPGMNGIQAKGLYSSSLLWSSLKGRTSNRLSGMASGSVFLLLLVNLFRSFFLGWAVVGGSYSAAMVANLALSWPLSSKRSRRKEISFCVCSGVEQSLWARHNSPLNVAMAVSGSWHD